MSRVCLTIVSFYGRCYPASHHFFIHPLRKVPMLQILVCICVCDVLESRLGLLFGLVFFAFFGWFLSETLGTHHCFGMVYCWFLLCQCIQRPQWQHIGEMGLLWLNVCRGYIMLTLVMCSGPCQCIQRATTAHRWDGVALYECVQGTYHAYLSHVFRTLPMYT